MDDDDDDDDNNKLLFQQSAILAVQVTVADISVFPASPAGSFSAVDQDFAEDSTYFRADCRLVLCYRI
jgi:hypothetical protein